LEEQETIKIQKKRSSRRIINWLLYIVGAALTLVLITALLVQFPSVQRYLKNEVVAYLNTKLGDKARVGKISIAFPGAISLQHVFLADPAGDTLIYGERIDATLDIWKLLISEIQINDISLRDIRIKLSADSAGNFNFGYIVEAFKPTKPAILDTSKTVPINFKLETVRMDRVTFFYKDSSSGIDGIFQIGQLRANVKSLELDKQNFVISNLEWNQGSVDLKMFPTPKKIRNDTLIDVFNRLPHFLIDDAVISDIRFNYDYPDDEMDMAARIGNYKVENLLLLLTPQEIHLGKSTIKNSTFTINMGSGQPKDLNPDALPTPQWKIFGDEIALLNTRFTYNDIEAPNIKKGMDYGHLSFSQINLRGNNLYVYGGDMVRVNITEGALLEKSGFTLKQLATDLQYTSQGVSLKNMKFLTPHTLLNGMIEVSYPSPSIVSEHPETLWINANLKPSVVGHKDLLNVVPLLENYDMFSKLPAAKMEIAGVVKGKLNNLWLGNVTVKAFGGTRAKVTGWLTGLPDPYLIGGKLSVSELKLTAADLLKIIPPGTLPGSITLPQTMTIKGKMDGNFTKSMVMDVSLISSLGNAAVKGWIKNADDAERVTYKLSGNLNNTDIGKLTGDEKAFGKITATFSANGKGFNPKTLTSNFTTLIKVATLQGMTIHDVAASGIIENGVYDIKSNSSYPGQAFDVVLQANLHHEFPNINATAKLLNFDFQQMGFTEKPFLLRANIETNIPTLNMDAPYGYATVTEISGVYDTLAYQFDTLHIRARQTELGQRISFESDFANARMEGRFSPIAIFPEIQQYLVRYYDLGKPLPALRGDQQVNMLVSIKPSPQLKQLWPDMEMSNSVEMSLAFDSKLCIFNLDGAIPRITAMGNSISGGTISAIGNDSSIAYKIYLNDIGNEKYGVPTALIEGDILNNIIYNDLRLLDDKGRLQHTFSFSMQHSDSGYALHFDPNSVLLDYEKWGLDADNELFLTKDGVFASSFTFSNGSQALVMNTFGTKPNDPLGIRLFNFEISTFTSIARQDSLYLNGTINGYAELQLETAYPIFNADFDVSNLRYKLDTIGNIILDIHNEKVDELSLTAKLSGNENLLEAAGSYNTITEYLDVQLDIEKLEMQTIEPFMMGYLNRLSGHMEGGISVSGTMDKPEVIGNILFRNAEANVPFLNSVFSLRNERIRFLKDGIHFNNFTLKDAIDRKAVLNGTLLTTNWLDYRYALNLEANDFRIINSTRRDNKLIYGTLFMDTKVDIRGSTASPDVSAFFKVNSKTILTMVLPQNDPELAEREGVIEFFDEDNPIVDSTLLVLVDSINTSEFKGLALSANVEIDPNAQLNFVIDEANGDLLVAKGTANLSMSIDPSGKISLTGDYELYEGSYEMSLQMLKYKFDIDKGSTIRWTGEPTAADINVTAIYNARTAPFELVENMIVAESAESQAKFRDRMSFKVLLMVKGELLKPDITFDIQIAETSGSSAQVVNTVNSKLDQLRLEPSEMNKQVFALILIGGFVPENPLGSSSGSGGVSAFARQSVSNLLADQLNRVAGSLIEGVDVDIGIDSEEDFSMGTGTTRTDLNVALSKKLLKDRLKISVGSNFELEGAARPNEKTSNIAGDIKLDYLLSKSGQYILRGYRVDQYEVALQGQVVETGVTFIITLEFEKFKEIFEKKKNK
jgi:hypothetical protein